MRASRFAMSSIVLLAAVFQVDAATPNLCQAQERVVFACKAKVKVLSLCGAGEIGKPSQTLVYRFGKDAQHVELEQALDLHNPQKQTLTFNDNSWPKGYAFALGFDRGEFRYFVAQDYATIDDKDNFGEVIVLRGKTKIAKVSCDGLGEDAVNFVAKELHGIKLPKSSDIDAVFGITDIGDMFELPENGHGAPRR